MRDLSALRWSRVAPAVALAAIASPAAAEGVPAGTLINNTATATYQANGTERTIASNAVEIRVDELLNVAVASQNGAPVPSTGRAVLTFRVTNTGNGPEAFTLTADPAVGGNPFDPTLVQIAIDTNGNGIFDEGDTVIANGGSSGLIAPDASSTVFVIVDTSAAPDGQTARVQLTAVAATGSGTPGATFAGQGDGGGNAVVGAGSANDSDTGAVVTSQAAVTLRKSATIADPFGGTQPVPGAVVSFQIAAQVSGSGTVSGLTITDPIPAGTTYRAGSLRLNGNGLTDAVDADAGRASGAGIAVAVGDVAAGAAPTVTFDVTID